MAKIIGCRSQRVITEQPCSVNKALQAVAVKGKMTGPRTVAEAPDWSKLVMIKVGCPSHECLLRRELSFFNMILLAAGISMILCISKKLTKQIFVY